ncbi:hypothetical protein V500_09095 [Pseudogymnoascus sp. VKM F-4518 (FW-2643)]|nr:hypothetical protein V500_09095 [Pseudogymnoascus sp. VKM F-4518 (FW-2643)]
MDDGACQALAMSRRRTACAARRSKVAMGLPDHTAGSEINRFRVLRPLVSPCHSMESSRYRERGSSVHAARPGEFPLAASAADWCGTDPCVDAGHAPDEQLWIDTSGRGYVRADNRHAGCHDEYWPSHLPTNDVMIVLVQNSASPIISQLSHWKVLLATKTILWTEIVMGIMALSGTVFSSLLGDLWAVVLFASYLVFWVASTISFRQLNLPDSSIAIKADEKTVFAIHQRPVGGLVIFKGRQDVLERWARTKWVFEPTLASVACMVNMGALLQLAFLGMLLYASAAELWLTVLAHLLQTSSIVSLDLRSTKEVKYNDKRFKSIIQASLGLEKEYRLDKLRWIGLDLLPSTLVFKAMVEVMDFLNGCDENNAIVQAEEQFHKRCEEERLTANDIETRDRIWSEVKTVWAQRNANKLPVQV